MKAHGDTRSRDISLRPRATAPVSYTHLFPVFNVADCAIVVGAGLLILYFILDSVKESKQKKAEEKQADE